MLPSRKLNMTKGITRTIYKCRHGGASQYYPDKILCQSIVRIPMGDQRQGWLCDNVNSLVSSSNYDAPLFTRRFVAGFAFTLSSVFLTNLGEKFMEWRVRKQYNGRYEACGKYGEYNDVPPLSWQIVGGDEPLLDIPLLDGGSSGGSGSRNGGTEPPRTYTSSQIQRMYCGVIGIRKVKMVSPFISSFLGLVLPTFCDARYANVACPKITISSLSNGSTPKVYEGSALRTEIALAVEMLLIPVQEIVSAIIKSISGIDDTHFCLKWMIPRSDKFTKLQDQCNKGYATNHLQPELPLYKANSAHNKYAIQYAVIKTVLWKFVQLVISTIITEKSGCTYEDIKSVTCEDANGCSVRVDYANVGYLTYNTSNKESLISSLSPYEMINELGSGAINPYFMNY